MRAQLRQGVETMGMLGFGFGRFGCIAFGFATPLSVAASALGDGLVTVGWGGVLKITDAGRAALAAQNAN